VKKKVIITVDGPSGAGKSTVARLLASVLDLAYVDTGAMYRAVAFAFRERGNKSCLSDFLASLDLKFDFMSGAKVFLDGQDISDDIRHPDVSLLASDLSQRPEVRAFLTMLQRRLGEDGGVVVEGRDTGSVVFPDADVKFFLDARQTERAKRRFIELKSKGIDQSVTDLEKEMAERDRNDSERDIAPLVIPDGAICIDSTDLDIQSVVRFMVRCIGEKEML